MPAATYRAAFSANAAMLSVFNLFLSDGQGKNGNQWTIKLYVMILQTSLCVSLKSERPSGLALVCLFFVSSEPVLSLFFHAPILFSLSRERESFLAWWERHFSVVGYVSVECFEVYLVLFECFDLAVYFLFNIYGGGLVENF